MNSVDEHDEPAVLIGPESPWNAGVSSLIDALDRHLDLLYPAEFNHKLSLSQLDRPDTVLLIARVDGVAVGCGAVRFVPDAAGDYAEIKRMFVDHGYRRRGIAWMLLRALEEVAANRQLSIVRLETGIKQPEARAMYERAGYSRRSSYGDYDDNEVSVFYEKWLN